MLKQALSDVDLAFLEVIEDPVLLGEFLRNTADGSVVKEEWPKRRFKYRWYQKDILTDRNENIIFRAGRAVGKCSPESAKIFTTDGYKTIGTLLREKRGFCSVYCLGNNGEIVQRRAQISRDGNRAIWEVYTIDGKSFKGTAEHPLLTQRGWIPIKELDKDTDYVAVVTHLPWESEQNIFNWYELRFLGYCLGNQYKFISAEVPIPVKFQKQSLELHMIAQASGCNVKITKDGYIIKRERRGLHKHYLNMVLDEVDEDSTLVHRIPTRLPSRLMQERLSNLKIFLESYLSMVASITPTRTTIEVAFPELAENVQELLLRFGIVTRCTILPMENWTGPKVGMRKARYIIETYDDYAHARLLSEFDIPGINVKNIPILTKEHEAHTNFRFEKIKSIEQGAKQDVYAVFVYEHHNYISDNLIVHNSIILEDLMIYETLNHDIMFPETKEQTLATANMNQMTPILDRLTSRFMNSTLLKSLAPLPNRSKGTIDFPIGSTSYRIYSRIAGSRGENNMVGLHTNKLKVDEAQLFPWSAYIQVLPTINQWEQKTQRFFAGVPNGNINGSVLWYLDQKADNYKKYRIPAHENPFFTEEDNVTALRQYGGENSNEYMQLVLGEHGNPIFNVIPRDRIKFEPFEFFSYRYNQGDKDLGKTYSDIFKLPKVPENLRQMTVFAIDCGYADPTVIQVMGYGEDRVWRTLARYRMTRIPFPEQAIVIDWLDEFWKPEAIGIDLGAGGGGITIMQHLQSDQFKRWRSYQKKIYGVRFGDNIVAGEDPLTKDPLKWVLKSWAGNHLAKIVGEHELVLSEIDMEAASQLERVSFTRRADGSMRFFVMSESGHGESEDDHIFASYVVFVGMLSSIELRRAKTKKLFSPRWVEA